MDKAEFDLEELMASLAETLVPSDAKYSDIAPFDDVLHV